MFQRRIPEWLRHAPAPSLRGFAALAGVESAARGILVSVFPIAMYKTFGDSRTVSEIYFVIGIGSLAAVLLVPWVVRFIARRRVYTLGVLMMIGGGVCAALGGPLLLPIGLAATTIATVIMFVCFNAYVLDYVDRVSLGECETLRLFYSGLAWTIGPFLGIWLMDIWMPAPFVLSAIAAIVLLTLFWVMRLGDGKLITLSKAPQPNPLAYLPRFFAQPRLIAGWSFAVLRSCGWWVYVVYLPIYAVENGFSDQLGGLLLSITNSFLFLTPFMLRWMHARSVRHAVRIGFLGSAAAFALAAVLGGQPMISITLLMIGSFYLVLLDMSGGLPFLMAVKPSERTEMSAVYATYRDVSGVVTPGVARLVLAVAPLPAVFAATAIGLAGALVISAQLHPRLGGRRAFGS
jgi:MFS family permease